MRGEILKPDDPAGGGGLILGEDGKRYHYTSARVHKASALSAGAPVDFIALGDEARDIYPLTRPAAPAAEPTAPSGYAAAAQGAPARPDNLWRYFLRALSANYFQFNGRARRSEYWGFVLFFILALIAIFIIEAVIAGVMLGLFDTSAPEYFPVFTLLFYIYALIPGIAIAVRRLHDRGLSGWLYLVNLVPYIGGIVLLVLMCLDSDPGHNKHGPNPKYKQDDIPDTFL